MKKAYFKERFQFNIDYRLLDTLDVNSQKVVGEIAKLNSDYIFTLVPLLQY